MATPAPFAASGWSATSPTTPGAGNNFLADYSAFLRTNPQPPAVAAWLLDNWRRMNEAMFFADPGFDWTHMSIDHILFLRAVAPSGVFTPTAKGAYLSGVRGKAEYLAIADALFGEGRFPDSLPMQFANRKPMLRDVVRWADENRRDVKY